MILTWPELVYSSEEDRRNILQDVPSDRNVIRGSQDQYQFQLQTNNGSQSHNASQTNLSVKENEGFCSKETH